MENVIFNGDLYIKFYPTRVSQLVLDSGDDKQFDSPIDGLSMEDIVASVLHVIENLDELLEEHDAKSIEKFDYSSNSGFYYLSIDPEGYRLTSDKHVISGLFADGDGNYFEKQTNEYCIFETIDEVNEHFISLSDFLLNAKKTGFVLEPLKEGLEKLIVLYEYKDTYLVINSNGQYDVISKHHPLISSYMSGEKIYDDVDRKKIFLEIFKQKFGNSISR